MSQLMSSRPLVLGSTSSLFPPKVRVSISSGSAIRLPGDNRTELRPVAARSAQHDAHRRAFLCHEQVLKLGSASPVSRSPCVCGAASHGKGHSPFLER